MRAWWAWGALLAVYALYSCGGDGTQTTGPTSGPGGQAGAMMPGGQAGAPPAQGGAAGEGGELPSRGGAGGTGGDNQAGMGGQLGGMGGMGGQLGGMGGMGGMSGGALGDPCTHGMGTCNQGLYCNALGCGAGTCALPLSPAAQSKLFNPVCGCNGVSYYNATIAESKSAAVSHAGECTSLEAIACNKVNMPCGTGLACNALVANLQSCPPSPNVIVPGTCWGVPIACDPAGPQARGCGGMCADTCSLIQGQNAWYDDLTCP